ESPLLAARSRPEAALASSVDVSGSRRVAPYLLVPSPKSRAHEASCRAPRTLLGTRAMSNMEPSFSVMLQRFFTQRLMQQKKVSPHTLCSYRDTFRLLLRFAKKKLHVTPEQLGIEQIDAPFVTAFLSDLESGRGVSARTRNLRLTAIRSFFRFASYELPSRSAQIQRVLATPRKKYTRRLIGYLTRPEVEVLLSAPDKHTWTGRRDHALM